LVVDDDGKQMPRTGRGTLAAPIRQVTPVKSAASSPTTALRTLDFSPSAPMTILATRSAPSANATWTVPSARGSTRSVRFLKCTAMPAAVVASMRTF